MKEVCAVLFVVITLWCGIFCPTKVNSGSVGVLRYTGAIQPAPLSEGLHFTRPWPLASVEEVSTQMVKEEAEAHAASRDLQGVKTKVSVQWAVTASVAPIVLQSFGDAEKLSAVVLAPAIQEVVKAVCSQFTAEELITRRANVKLQVEQDLRDFVAVTLTKKGAAWAIVIASVAMTDFDFSPEFNAAIEAKVKAQQDSFRAENEKTTKITQAEAHGREVTVAAEAEATSTKLAADATAYRTEAESKARAAAITREAAALSSNPGLVQLRIAERWNGALPTYTGAGIPLLQLGK